MFTIPGVWAQETSDMPDSLACGNAFADAILESDTAQFDSLLLLTTDVDCATANGVTPLMYASQEGNVLFVTRLLNAGADVNRVPQNKVTALLSATASGNTRISRLLLDRGANVYVSDAMGNTPVINAAANNNYGVVQLLVERGAAVDSTSIDGNSALHFAAAQGNDSLLIFLIENGASLNKQEVMGFTPLMVAVAENHTNCAELLVSYGAEVNIKNKENQTVLILSIINGNAYLAELFLLNGSDKGHLEGTAKDYWYLAQGTGNDMKKVFRANSVKRNLLPVVGDFTGGLSASWYDGHLESSFVFGIRETKYNLLAHLDLGFTPFVYRSRDKINGIDYQFWERNYWLALGVEKYFAFHKTWRTEGGLFAGVKSEYRIGRYRGTGFRPDAELELFPLGGVYFRYDAVEFKLVCLGRNGILPDESQLSLQVHFYFSRL